jgi:hypothetical protein
MGRFCRREKWRWWRCRGLLRRLQGRKRRGMWRRSRQFQPPGLVRFLPKCPVQNPVQHPARVRRLPQRPVQRLSLWSSVRRSLLPKRSHKKSLFPDRHLILDHLRHLNRLSLNRPQRLHLPHRLYLNLRHRLDRQLHHRLPGSNHPKLVPRPHFLGFNPSPVPLSSVRFRTIHLGKSDLKILLR